MVGLNGEIEWLNGGAEWLNGRSEQSNILAILHVLNVHMGLVLVPMNSAHHAGHFDTWLISL